ncbi:KPN_02809 family neutral zinc metallopeptidase [Variovorax sp. PAMC 28711]|uniref:KPN_02809 family neutral zinc metallopeptidase n=1 Tax=Variovorax sp. PAMC 28711 TaxID=1795631 RepID=UPI00078D9BCA|nr:neutral zinc metallopeptidase [Variovorax sp. PAMC 28711]AMM23623.1 metalloprotease [Variovorax sp. PAMC 28711]
MRWEGNEQSDNVEDRRDSGGGGGGGGFIGGRSIGIGTVAVALIAGWVFGINPLTVLGLLSGGSPAPQVQQQGPAHAPPPSDRQAAFVSTVLKNTEVVWTDLFRQNGGTYHAPKLVLFRGVTPTACGTGQAAMGPFYCPGDQKVYIDLAFYDTLKNQLGAPGEFAQAYVIAHEVGHHVQDELGITAKVDGMRGRLSQTQNNAISVRVELQADCFAGVWANHSQESKKWLDPGDIEAAMNAAQKIGDDALQRSAGRAVVPDSFTHGSSAQRQKWFGAGYQSGSMSSCDTFNAKTL